MNQKVTERYRQVASDNRLHFDEQKITLYGDANGYSLCIAPMTNGQWTLYASVCRANEIPNNQDMRVIVKASKRIASCGVKRHKVQFILRLSNKTEKMSEQLGEVIAVVTRGLRQAGYENCCESCGEQKATEAYQVSGAGMLLCDGCFATISSDVDMRAQQLEQKKESLVGGIVGALIGSLIGAAVIVILGQLGYVAAVSGFIIAICALKGYEMASGKLSNAGIIISSVIMLGMIYLANRIDWTITVAKYFEVDAFSSFRAIPELLHEGYIEASTYYFNLGLVYLFAIVGAVPTIITSVKNREIKNITGKMQDTGRAIPPSSYL